MSKKGVELYPGVWLNMDYVSGVLFHGVGRRGEHGPNPEYHYEPQEVFSENIKKKMEEIASKNPVTILQELHARYGIPLKYEFMHAESVVPEPIFYYRVTVKSLTATGSGKSKDEAKLSAAAALMDKLQSPDPVLNLPQAKAMPIFEDIALDNPVGTLQELCLSRFWALPSYHDEKVSNTDDNGSSHEPLFNVVCTLMGRLEVGTATSKKLGKRQAAYKMWQSVRNLPSESIGSDIEEAAAVPFNELPFITILNEAALRYSQICTGTEQSGQYGRPKLETFVVKNVNKVIFNFVEFLNEFATEKSFEVVYIDLEEKSTTGLYQCLIHLSVIPIAICRGSGTTREQARSTAAENALEYLKITTKKDYSDESEF